MLTNILLSFTSVVALLALLDWLLSDAQKKRVSDLTVVAWNRLDEMKHYSFVRPFQSRAMRLVLCAAAATVSARPFLEEHFGFSKNPLVKDFFLVVEEATGTVNTGTVLLVTLLLATFSGIVGYVSLTLLLRNFSMKALALKSTALLLIALAPSASVLALSVPIQVFILSLFISSQFAFIWFVVVFPLAIAVILSGLLYSAELIVRRIAEHPKGPVIALSTFLTLVLAIMKVFS